MAYTLIDTMGPSMLVCVIACAALVQVTRRAATHAPAGPGAAARPLGRTIPYKDSYPLLIEYIPRYAWDAMGVTYRRLPLADWE